MKIAQFLEAVQTTKDTVRHYEVLGLLHPEWISKRRIYSEREISDFQAIKEMQALDLSLKEIQVIFQMKRNNGCGSRELLEEVIQTMDVKQRQLIVEEQVIKNKKEQISELLAVLKSEFEP